MGRLAAEPVGGTAVVGTAVVGTAVVGPVRSLAGRAASVTASEGAEGAQALTSRAAPAAMPPSNAPRREGETVEG